MANSPATLLHAWADDGGRPFVLLRGRHVSIREHQRCDTTGVTCLAIAVLTFSTLVHCAEGVESRWVQRGVTGRLMYVPDAEGDRLPDFSDVGYRGGKEPIPHIAAVVAVNPIAGDDTAHVQAAIDQVAALPLGENGFRGAVELGPGEYDIAGQLTIAASGIVLRGAGRGETNTVLRARGTSQRDLIRILGTGSQSLQGTARNMIDKTVPVGSRSFRLDSTEGLAVGDTVRVTRPSTEQWIADLGMDNIPPRPDGSPITQWQPGTMDLRFDRVITRIEGNRVFVDAPLTNAFELQYGGGQIKRYTWPGRIENIGIENLRAESDFASESDEDHSWNFVSIDKAQNVWVRNTASAHFARSAVLSHPGAKWVTVDDAKNFEPKSQITGSRRYTFDLSGQLELVTNSEANEGRHDFVNNSTRPAGPHVFHRSVAYDALDESGPHQRWATGSLFDNITVEGDQINARNRGNFGTGHGWAGANMVIWNSHAESYIVQNPPTAQNWLIGSTGTIIDDQTFGPQPPGYVDAHGTPVAIESLYEAQQADAADITHFHWAGGVANWNDPLAWHQQVTPGHYRVESRDYLIGDIDDLTNDGPGSVDDAYIDPTWESAISGMSQHPIVGFDEVASNRNVAFTIEHQLAPDERVVHGTLALALRQSGGDTATDFLRLFDTDAKHRLGFEALGWSNQLSTTETFVGMVDLGTFIDELQAGQVNVQVNDDTAVDWALYTVTIAIPQPTALPALVSIDGGGEATINSPIDGVGSLTLGGASDGTLKIAEAGVLNLSQDYVQGANGNLEFVIDNEGPDSRLNVGGSASLDGHLAVTLGDDFTPEHGDTFTLLEAVGAMTSVFGSVVLPTLPDGLGWQLHYTDAAIALEVTLSGDFNSDGIVNLADYTVWRDTLGSETVLDADADANRVVDINDYQLWKQNLGATVAAFGDSGTLAAAVPEPGTHAVVLFLLAAGVRFRSPSPSTTNLSLS